MAVRSRCRNCGCLFRPDPRVGKRQHTCRALACQRERHRRSCADWYRRVAPVRSSERIQTQVRYKSPPPPPLSPSEKQATDPMVRPPGLHTIDLDWKAIERIYGLAHAALWKEAFRAIRAHMAAAERNLRDEIRPYLPDNKRNIPNSPHPRIPTCETR